MALGGKILPANKTNFAPQKRTLLGLRCKGYSSKSLLYKPEGFEEGAVDNDALCVLYLQEGLAQSVDPGNLEQLPQVVHRQTDNQVGDDHGDEDEEHDEE